MYEFSWKEKTVRVCAYIKKNIPSITVFHETKPRHLDICADSLALLRFPFEPVLRHFISPKME